MHTPKISVIVPVYNVQNYLRQCLDSIIGQSFSNFEMICINDGSTDDSPQILEQYAALDSRIRIISQPNRGLSAARNAGLAQATAEYIFFIDSDDYIEPDTLEKLFDTARRTGADLTCADFLPFPETEADQKETKTNKRILIKPKNAARMPAAGRQSVKDSCGCQRQTAQKQHHQTI